MKMPEGMGDQQQKEDSSAQVALEECIQLLKGPTNERRRASLLVLIGCFPEGSAASETESKYQT